MIENIFLEGPAGEELPSFRNNHFVRPLAAVVGASSGQTQVNLLSGGLFRSSKLFTRTSIRSVVNSDTFLIGLVVFAGLSCKV